MSAVVSLLVMLARFPAAPVDRLHLAGPGVRLVGCAVAADSSHEHEDEDGEGEGEGVEDGDGCGDQQEDQDESEDGPEQDEAPPPTGTDQRPVPTRVPPANTPPEAAAPLAAAEVTAAAAAATPSGPAGIAGVGGNAPESGPRAVPSLGQPGDGAGLATIGPAVLPPLPVQIIEGPLGPAAPPLAVPRVPPRAPGSGTLWPAIALLIAVMALLSGLFGTGWYRARKALQTQTVLAGALGISRRHLAGIPASGAAALLTRVSELNRRVTVLESQAVTDDLTGVLRRGAGLAALERDLAAVRRSTSGRLAIVFVDLDGLKEVNDQLGHVEGDRLLRKVARALESGLRAQDLVFRFGGDEFVCILPESNAAAAWNKVREIRDGLAAEMGRIPFTHGTAEFKPGDTSKDLLARADADLYQRRGHQ